MNYIITGNCGLIGEALDRRLKMAHNEVLAIDQRKGFNILHLGALKLNPVTQKTDILYHLAAHCKIQEGIDNPCLPHENNADGTYKVLEFCRRNQIPRIMNFSSSRVLSRERNPYVASKVYGEELVKAYHDSYGLDFINVRPSTVYGPCNDITSRLLTTWVQSALKGGELKIYGDNLKTLDFTYVDDFIDAVMLLTSKWDDAKNRSYNISGGSEVNLSELADYIITKCGKGYKNFYPPETAQPQRVLVDTSRIKEMGFKPRVSIQKGVDKLVRYYKCL